MLVRETRVPEHVTYHVPAPESNVHDYVDELVKHMKMAHEVLRKQQWQVRSGDSDDPPLYKVGDWVGMTSHCRRRSQAAKLQPKFVGPYCMIEVMANHTYKVERSGQVSVQNEARLKPYWANPDAAGQAPPLLEPARRPPMRERGMAYRDVKELLPDQEGVVDTPADSPQPPPPQEEAADTPEDLSEPASPSVEPADRPITPNEMVFLQIHEEEAARETPPVLVEPPVLATPPVVVESPVAANPPVQLERSQCIGRHHLFTRLLVRLSRHAQHVTEGSIQGCSGTHTIPYAVWPRRK